jgi:hypothetical protein
MNVVFRATWVSSLRHRRLHHRSLWWSRSSAVPVTANKYSKRSMSAETEIESLVAEAAVLEPLVQWGVTKFNEGTLADYDLVGIYILSYLAIRRPKAWMGGKLKHPVPTNEEVGGSDASKPRRYSSVYITDVPLLPELLNMDYLKRKLGSVETLTVIDVFNSMHFVGIRNKDDHINYCVVNWALQKRPCVLLFRIPR